MKAIVSYALSAVSGVCLFIGLYLLKGGEANA